MKPVKVMIASLSVLLAGCASVMGALGYVPAEDLEVANRKVAALGEEVDEQEEVINTMKSELTTLQGELNQANRDLTAAQDEAEGMAAELGLWQALRCPDRTWEDAWTVQAVFPFRDVLDTPRFGMYVAFTQWRYESGWLNDVPSTTLLWDMDGDMTLVLDTDEDCIFINPEFSELGR